MKPHLVVGQCARPLRAQFLERLIDSGTWMSRDDLVANASSSPVAIEDTLADLVVDGLAEYRANVGYRLSGSVMARRAAKLMRVQGSNRQVCAQPVNGEYRVGVAEEHDLGAGVLSLVMYELAMPMPKPGPDSLAQHMAQVDAVMKFSTRGIEDGTSSV